ncbi:MAG TPA: preprotein translocase subunit SecE [Chloroflexota bacterium]|nr:preprotein translocase subunit SecE [Chloroflexota bacterium]
MAKSTASTPQDKAAGRSLLGSRGPARDGSRPQASVPARRNPPNLFAFFQESRAELRKVTWPTRQEASNLTLAVIGMTVGIAAFLGICDEILNRVIAPLIGAH